MFDVILNTKISISLLSLVKIASQIKINVQILIFYYKT